MTNNGQYVGALRRACAWFGNYCVGVSCDDVARWWLVFVAVGVDVYMV